LALALLTISILPYAGSWNGEFLWDDNSAILDSELIKDSSGWWKIWIAPPPSHPDYFPLTTLSFWTEWRVWGDSPVGYRVVNTLLHAASVLMLWRLLCAMGLSGAWIAAALFAVHPVNVESVAWISERKNLLAMLFAVPSFFYFIRWDTTKRLPAYLAALVCFFLATSAKASVVTLPLVFATWSVWRYGFTSLRRFAVPLIPFLLISLGFSIAVIHFQNTRAVGDWDIQMPGILGRIGQAGMAFWFYLGKGVFPIGLATIYPRCNLDPNAALALLLAGLLIAGGGLLWIRRDKISLGLAFGLTSYALLLLPTLGLLKMSFMKYAPVSDHFQHLALPAILATMACGIASLLNHYPRFKRPATIFACCMLAVLASASASRARIHASHEALWRDAMTKNPDSPQPHTILATILQESGRVGEAEAHFQEAARLAPDDQLILTNLGVYLLQTKQPKKAESTLQKAISAGNKYPETYIYLSRASMEQGDLDKALDTLAAGCIAFPGDVPLNSTAASSFLVAGRFAEALHYIEQCERLLPDNPAAFRKEAAAALRGLGRHEEPATKLREIRP
jgi:Flp pilus assembly protein TadD